MDHHGGQIDQQTWQMMMVKLIITVLRLGDHQFYGPGSEFVLDTTKPFTVVTQVLLILVVGVLALRVLLMLILGRQILMMTKLVKVKISAVLDRRWHWQWKPCGDAQVSGVCYTGILLKTKSIRIWSKTLNLLTKITRVWVQDGKVIPNAMTNMPGTFLANNIQRVRSWNTRHSISQIKICKYSMDMDKHNSFGVIVQVSTRSTRSQTTFAARPR